MTQRPSQALENGERRSSDTIKKRKLQARPSEENSAPLSKQQTISELFTASQQKASVGELSPNSKRQRLDQESSPLQPMVRPNGTTHTTLPADKMYNFTSRNGVNEAKEVIDLTNGSPTASPRRPLNGRLRPTFNANAAPKKLVVKNLRTMSRSDPIQYLNSTWERLDTALTVQRRGECVQAGECRGTMYEIEGEEQVTYTQRVEANSASQAE